MNLKWQGRKLYWPNFRYYSVICLRETKKNHENLRVDCVPVEIRIKHPINPEALPDEKIFSVETTLLNNFSSVSSVIQSSNFMFRSEYSTIAFNKASALDPSSGWKSESSSQS
jgi:hypothetical protein